MKIKFLYIVLVGLVLLSVAPVRAQGKARPKTLKELIAEEKAAKEAEKAAKEAESQENGAEE